MLRLWDTLVDTLEPDPSGLVEKQSPVDVRKLVICGMVKSLYGRWLFPGYRDCLETLWKSHVQLVDTNINFYKS